MARPKKFDDGLRDRLIDAAAAQIAAGGVGSVALRPLAAAQDCSTTAIYSLFGSRAGLVQAVVERAEQGFAASQFDSPRTDRPLDDLFELGMNYRRWALANADLYQVMFVDPSLAQCEPAAEPTTGSIEPLVAAVRRAVADGHMHGDLEAITRSIWAGVHGWVMLELRGFPVTDEQYRDHLATLPAPWMNGREAVDD